MTVTAQDASRTWPQVGERHRDHRRFPPGIAFMDGQYLPISEAKLPVLDWGFLHSDATYDTAHVWEGRFFRLDRHLDRFFGGIERLRLAPGLSRDEIAEILVTCVGLSGLRAAYVEMICTRGMSPSFSRDPREAENRFIAFAVPFGSVANAGQMRTGLHVALSDLQRIPDTSVDPRIKNYHWLDLVQGLFGAYDRGADTALLRDGQGGIAEGPGFNVFAVRDGALTTPDRGVLPGITRQTVFELCGKLSLPVAAEQVTENALRRADEVFITSTAGGIMPVTRIDGEPIGDGRVGPVTSRLTELYWDMHRDPLWTTPVAYPPETEDDGGETRR